MKHQRLWFAVLIVLFWGGGLVSVLPALADDLPIAEIGILGGVAAHDEDLLGLRVKEVGTGPLGGVRLAYRIGPGVFWYADGTWSTFVRTGVHGHIDVATIRTGPEFMIGGRDMKPGPWFVAVGAGLLDINWDYDLSTYRPLLVSLGLGRRFPVGPGSFRVEARGDRTIGDEGKQGVNLINVQGLVGWSWGFAGPPSDSDGDGVPDKMDQCPDTPRGVVVDSKGCPVDGDGDGVPDYLDKCADTPRGVKVDGKGCPIDSDADGVPDYLDKCADTPRGVKVDANGCPLDSDGDGVPDYLDKCPDTAQGVKVDANGCPLPEAPKPTPKPIFQEGKKSLILEGVNFETNKAVLTADSHAILDAVAASLNDWPNIKVEVGGHTDWVGQPADNQRLSDARAKSVRDYLISKGVAASRLTSVGYGEERPIADNTTAEGRAKNRRVELTQID